VTQGQRAVTTQVYIPYLNIRLATAQVVLPRQLFSQGAVTGFIVNGGYQVGIFLIVVFNSKQL